MTKIWAEAFWKAEPDTDAMDPGHNPPLSNFMGLVLPIAALAAITIIIGLFSQPFFELANDAANQLLNPNEYIQAVRPVLRG
jgi:multicomponent Na+:H+ antiporter subunit D